MKKVKQFINKYDHYLFISGFFAGIITSSMGFSEIYIVIAMIPFMMGTWSLFKKEYEK